MGTLQDGELKKPTAQRDATLYSNVLMSLMSFGAPERTGLQLMAVSVIFNKSYESGNNTNNVMKSLQYLKTPPLNFLNLLL